MKKFINVSMLLISSILISLSATFVTKANSWNQTDTGWEFISNGEVLKNTWFAETIPVGNKRSWYYIGANGRMVTGWKYLGSNWYYLAQNGVMQTGWLQDNNNWYFLDSSGKMQVGWLYYDDNWYFLNAYGQMLTGWVLDNGKSYYLDKTSGYMLTSTTTPDGNQVDENGVYINPNSSNSINDKNEDSSKGPGVPKGNPTTTSTSTTNFNNGWNLVNTVWYYQKADSNLAKNEWLSIEQKWYHFSENGQMQIGWLKDNDKWYYLDLASGSLKTGWEFINGKWYYLSSPNGDLLVNTTTPDNFRVNENGERIE